MRWVGHLLGALFVGVIVIIVLEEYFGVSISRVVSDFFASYGIGAGLMIAILIVVAVLLWWRSSRG